MLALSGGDNSIDSCCYDYSHFILQALAIIIPGCHHIGLN